MLPHCRNSSISSAETPKPAKCSSAYNNMDPCPALKMKRSLSAHSGSCESNLRCRDHKTWAMGAAPKGIPGWPDPAFSTASIARVRMVFTAKMSSLSSPPKLTPSINPTTFPSLSNNLPRTRTHTLHRIACGRRHAAGRTTSRYGNILQPDSSANACSSLPLQVGTCHARLLRTIERTPNHLSSVYSVLPLQPGSLTILDPQGSAESIHQRLESGGENHNLIPSFTMPSQSIQGAGMQPRHQLLPGEFVHEGIHLLHVHTGE